MIRRTIIFFALGLSNVLHAQDIKLIDTLNNKITLELKESTHRLDSIKKLKNETLDSVDQLNNRVRHNIQKANNIISTPLTTVDTLNRRLDGYQAKLESKKQKLSHKIDSVKQLGLPHEKYSKALDSLNNLNPIAQFQKVGNQISDAQSKAQSKLNQPAEKVNEKLDLLRKETEGQGNLPGNVNAGIPGTDTNLSNLSPKTNLLPSNVTSDAGLSDRSVHTDKLVPDDLTKKFETKLPTREGIKIQNDLSEVSQVSDKVSGYTTDVKSISSGDLSEVKQIDKDVVNKINTDEVEVLKDNEAILENQKDAVRSLRNQEEFKKATLAKAREIVAKQLASQQTKIGETVNKISQHQKRVGSIFSKVKDLPKRPKKEKKPPVIERFVPGLTLQVQRTNNWFVDIDPTIRYRIRSIFSAGVGWNERIEFDKKFTFYKDNRVFGLRSFYELSIKKGFLLRADIERMSAFVPISPQQQDVGSRKNVWSYMAGVKKEFSFVSGVVGNAQFMYNLYDPDGFSPYFNRLNVRVGFEFPLKKKAGKKAHK